MTDKPTHWSVVAAGPAAYWGHFNTFFAALWGKPFGGGGDYTSNDVAFKMAGLTFGNADSRVMAAVVRWGNLTEADLGLEVGDFADEYAAMDAMIEASADFSEQDIAGIMSTFRFEAAPREPGDTTETLKEKRHVLDGLVIAALNLVPSDAGLG